MRDTTSTSDSVLQNAQFLKKLIQLPFIDEVWLYGSRARGDQTERSDIDIAIVCPRATETDWLLVEEIIDKADTLLNIDCVRFDTLTNEILKQNILRYKKILYVKDSGFMAKEVWHDSFIALGNALNRLQEALVKPTVEEDELYQDATIQRFEFCIELFWKVLKRLLAEEEVIAATPREVMQKAFQASLIDDDKIWLSMMSDCNKTSHIYEQEEAHRIFDKIKTYYPVMQRTYTSLKTRFFKES